ncbi:MAG: hypothetical protein JXA89_21770 [Anaerolineae bacterium]|nr:hypothetical protein [Anaerolineae bacterium]
MPKLELIFYKSRYFFLGVLILAGLYLLSLYNYLLFHCLAEIFSVLVAWSIFVIAWNSRRFHTNHYFLFVGIAYLFVGGTDLLHALAYMGMGVWPEQDADLPTQLWIAARYLESLSLLIAPWFLGHRLKSRWMFVAYSLVTGTLWMTIWSDIFPTCYVDGIGLTWFKRISEYVIALILVAAIVAIVRHRSQFDGRVFQMLIASAGVTIAAELAFTFYVDVYGLFNLLGHFLKIISFFLIYKAIIETGLISPYRLLLRDLKKNEDVLRQRAIQLQAHNEELDAFAHTVAHDLKNPLAGIKGNADLVFELCDTLSWDETKNHLLAISKDAHTMSNIIDELLLLSGVRKTQVRLQPIDMVPVVDCVLRRLDHMIQAYGAKIVLPDDWPVASGYGPWVEEVWANYLSNALVYGGRPPFITLGAGPLPTTFPNEEKEKKRIDKAQIRFWVRDNGPGIPTEELSRLFIPFTQLSQVETKGQGLGLSIVQRIVEKLGGKVGVESQVGQGSTFWFTLPTAG